MWCRQLRPGNGAPPVYGGDRIAGNRGTSFSANFCHCRADCRGDCCAAGIWPRGQRTAAQQQVPPAELHRHDGRGLGPQTGQRARAVGTRATLALSCCCGRLLHAAVDVCRRCCGCHTGVPQRALLRDAPHPDGAVRSACTRAEVSTLGPIGHSQGRSGIDKLQDCIRAQQAGLLERRQQHY